MGAPKPEEKMTCISLFQMMGLVFVFMFSLLLIFNTATADIDPWVVDDFVFPR